MSIKIGSKVEVLFFEEGEHDAPDDYIGAVGEVFFSNRDSFGGRTKCWSSF